MTKQLRQRYQEGACQDVWADLRGMGSDVYKEPTYEEATIVVQEAMRRVRHNIDQLIARLKMIGYRFGYSWAEKLIQDEANRNAEYNKRRSDPEFAFAKEFGGDIDTEDEVPNLTEIWVKEQMPLFVPPLADTDKHLQALEHILGVLPITFSTWYKNIGGINFVGMPPYSWLELGVDFYDLDPIVINTIESVLHFGRYNADHKLVYASSDQHVKYYQQGGMYEFNLAEKTVDFKFSDALHEEHFWFIDYLHFCFSWGGFPGWSRVKAYPEQDIKFLTEGLLDF